MRLCIDEISFSPRSDRADRTCDDRDIGVNILQSSSEPDPENGVPAFRISMTAFSW